MRLKVTPNFDEKLIMKPYNDAWFEFQSEAMDLGDKLLSYIREYINTNRHRSGGTGNLANSINIDKITRAGYNFWGIGDISELNTRAVYWYVLNYGTYIGTKEQFIPGKVKGGVAQQIPGYFGSHNAPISALKGKGSESFTYSQNGGFVITPGPIRPINYIQATQRQYDIELKNLLDRIYGK